MSKTARDLVTDALRTCGAIAISETPTSAEAVHALLELNSTIESLDTESLWPYVSVESSYSTVIGESRITISTEAGADINLARPNKVEAVGVETGNAYYPLAQVSNADWASRMSTGTDGAPVFYRFIPEMPSAVVEIHPTPSAVYNLLIVSQLRITELTLDSVITLPSGYYGYLQYALADLLAGQYGIDAPRITAEAKLRLSRIQRQNMDSSTLSIDQLPNGQGSYDIRTDEFL